MKYLKQFLIILCISLIGEVLKYYIPLPVPASIYGLVLLFILLECKVIRLSSIRETAKFLIEIMPVMFIPAGVGLMDSFGVLMPVLFPVLTITIVSTILVMGVSGLVTQAVIRKRGEKHE